MNLDIDALETSFDHVAAVTPKLRDTGARHVRYGAQPYPVVGRVLITSMAEIAGDAWTPEYEQAWTEAFASVAGAMLDGANSVASAA
jgi:hemoglobin-like flavoprotein